MAYNYIIIRVKEPDSQAFDGDRTRAGDLRKALHEWADKTNTTIADNIIRHDRPRYPLTGHPVPYREAEELFRKVVPPSMRDRLGR